MNETLKYDTDDEENSENYAIIKLMNEWNFN